MALLRDKVTHALLYFVDNGVTEPADLYARTVRVLSN
jgi:hypothetical protein